MRPKPKYMQPAQPDQDVLILSVRLESGLFETSLKIPFPAAPDELDKALTRWFAMAKTGFEIGANNMAATFDKSGPV